MSILQGYDSAPCDHTYDTFSPRKLMNCCIIKFSCGTLVACRRRQGEERDTADSGRRARPTGQQAVDARAQPVDRSAVCIGASKTRVETAWRALTASSARTTCFDARGSATLRFPAKMSAIVCVYVNVNLFVHNGISPIS